MSSVLRLMLLILLPALAGPAAARMYQWTDPDTGTTYLTGSPPAWYRTKAGGPRVLVFEEGKLVDDTGKQTSVNEQAKLREAALQELQARQQEARRRKAEQEAAAEPEPEEELAADVSQEDDAIAIFRAIIAEWDKRKSQGQGPGEQSETP